MDTKEIEYKLNLLINPFHGVDLTYPVILKNLKTYINNIQKLPEISKLISGFQAEETQVESKINSLRLKTLDEIESKEAKIIQELEDKKFFDFYSMYFRLKIEKEDAEENQIEEPEYNLSELEKIMMKLDDDRSINSFDIDSRFKNLDSLILFLRKPEYKNILSSIFTKNQLKINCRKFISFDYLRYQKELSQIDGVKKNTGWWIWKELKRITEERYTTPMEIDDIKKFIITLNNELLAKLEFGQLIEPEKLPTDVLEEEDEKHYRLSFSNGGFIEFKNLKNNSQYKYFYTARKRLGLPLKHEEVIKLGIAEMNEGEDRYKNIKNIVGNLNKRIKKKKLIDRIKFESEFDSAYSLTIK